MQPSRIWRKAGPRLCSSMHTASVAEALHLVEEKNVTIKGWVQTIRKQRTRAFAEINDGSSINSVQAILPSDDAQFLSTGSAVSVSGIWTRSPAGKEQAWELQATQVQALGANDAASNPLQKKYQTQEFLRTLPHLRSRIPRNALWLRVRSRAIAAATAFFAERDYIQTHTPILTSSDCEGAGEVFHIGNRQKSNDSESSQTLFFGGAKYLTVSAQLHLEALAQSVGKVWTLSPTFRAEQSDTARHLSEFYMLEAELAFTNELDHIMGLVEDLVKAISCGVYEAQVGDELLAYSRRNHRHESESVDLAARLAGIRDHRWPRISYHAAVEAIELAEQSGYATFEAPARHHGLTTEHERFIVAHVGRGVPVFVTDYPAAQKAFYMAPSSTQHCAEPTVSCFDLLLPEVCEVAGGSMREHRLESLQQVMQTRGVGQQGELDWYLDLRRFGSVEHGGFGLGFDRLLCYLVGVQNIREMATFPRWFGKCIC